MRALFPGRIRSAFPSVRMRGLVFFFPILYNFYSSLPGRSRPRGEGHKSGCPARFAVRLSGPHAAESVVPSPEGRDGGSKGAEEIVKCVFVHGLGQTPVSWNGTIQALGPGFDAVCPDLADLLRGKDLRYSDLYEAFSARCAGFSEPFHLCGLSLGGILALQYGLAHPGRVRSMVLVGTQYVMPKNLLKFQNMVFQLMPDRAFRATGFGKQAFITLSRSMMDLDLQQDLDRITCPVLVVCGEKDTANKRASLRLKDLLPHGEFRMIEHAGHEVNLDAPQELGALLRTFFQRYGGIPVT